MKNKAIKILGGIGILSGIWEILLMLLANQVAILPIIILGVCGVIVMLLPEEKEN